MFSTKKSERHYEQRNNAFNLIAGGTEINGDIVTNGDLRIDGKVMGNVTCNAKLVIGDQGFVVGNLHCYTGEISGTVEGRITSSEILQLNKGANVTGDIESVRFVVEDGASISGNCKTSNVLSVEKPAIKLIEYEQPKAISE